MRVIAGKVKGRKLVTVPGAGTRPVSDKVKGAVFDILASEVVGAHFLDLFGGTGSVGIEALSRGAGWADFVDQEPKACAIIKGNLREIGFSERGHVYCTGVGKALGFLKEAYGVVFMDPPYDQAKLIEGVVERLGKSALLLPGGMIVVCHASRSPLADRYDGVSLQKRRRYGDTTVSIFSKEATT